MLNQLPLSVSHKTTGSAVGKLFHSLEASSCNGKNGLIQSITTVFCALLLILAFANQGKAQTYNGYTLYFPQGGTKAYLADMSGNAYHTWTFSSSATTTYASYLLSGGVLLRTVNHAGNSFTGGPISGEVQKVDWSGNVLWDFVYSTTNYCSHHDIHEMPNGNVLLIAYERKTATDATAAGCSQSIEIWPDKIVEIQPSGTNGGTVVWEWHAWDHLVQHYDATKNNYGVVSAHPELLNINYNTSKDWMHMNGIDYNADLDQIVFSSHELNEMYVIDHSTTTAQAATHTGGNSGKGGDFLYRWGNPAAYETAGTADFNVVHDAHWISAADPTHPNELCGYNTTGGAGTKTCVDIFNPPYNGYNYSLTPGTSYAPATYDWRYTYSGNMQQDNGNSQQLPNGNTLICLGMTGLIIEINPSQTQVWSKSVGSTLPQAFRYPPCFVTGTYSAAATATPSTVCSGGSTQLNVTPTGDVAYIYQWTSVPAGFTSNVQSPTVSPTVNTVYNVTIKNGPCAATASVTVTVSDPPTATATATPNTICNGASSQLNVTLSGSGTYTYSWTSNPPGFTSTLQNPTVTPSVTTTYYVTATNGSCTANGSVVVTLSNPMTVAATAAPSSICPGQSSQLNAQVTGATSVTYAWISNPAGFTSTLQNPSVTPGITTTYTVTASNGTCIATNNTTVTVNTPFTVQASSNPGSICNGEQVQLSASPSGSASNSYTWTSNPTGFTTTIQNPTDSPHETTVYTVVVNDGNCSVSASTTVNVTGPISAAASALPLIVCAGDPSQLNVSVSGGANYQYAWTSNPAGFTSSIQNPIVNPVVPTMFYVTVQSSPCSASSSVSIGINPLPAKPSITQSGDTLYSSSLTGNQWFDNSVLMPGETSRYIVPNQSGSYQVQVTDGNGCSSVMSEAQIITSVIAGERKSSVSFYPNPGNGVFHINGLNGREGKTVVEVSDLAGKLLSTVSVASTVDMSTLPAGIYIARVILNERTVLNQKIVLIK